jgi:hypothetical protein
VTKRGVGWLRDDAPNPTCALRRSAICQPPLLTDSITCRAPSPPPPAYEVECITTVVQSFGHTSQSLVSIVQEPPGGLPCMAVRLYRASVNDSFWLTRNAHHVQGVHPSGVIPYYQNRLRTIFILSRYFEILECIV